MVCSDVKSLFTNVRLDRTTNIILKRIYDNAELDCNSKIGNERDVVIMY